MQARAKAEQEAAAQRIAEEKARREAERQAAEARRKAEGRADVSIPFRCPDNVVGESHMEGRIWVSAIHTIRQQLADAGLADRDAFGAAWLPALAAARQIPREQGELFADATAALEQAEALWMRALERLEAAEAAA